MSLPQSSSTIRITTPLGADVLGVESFHWTESLGQGFSATLGLLSDESDLDLKSILHKCVTIWCATNDKAGIFLNGFVYRAENLGADGTHFRYHLQLCSCMELLGFSGGYRVFQQMSTIDIAKKIFEERGLSSNLQSKTTQVYSPRNYCVQYGESDHDFLQRLFEEEGVYYYFEHQEKQHVLTLADDVSAHLPVPGYETVEYRLKLHPGSDEYLCNLSTSVIYGTGKISLGDYDYEKPSLALDAVKISSAVETPLERYHYPGRYATADVGQKAAQIKMEAIDARRERVTINGNTKGLRAGCTFKLADHPTESLNTEYLTISSGLSVHNRGWATGEANHFEISTTLMCQAKTVPFRLEQSTSKPRVYGPQIAKVTGKAGEEIWTDSLGRIKIQFPWDRLGTKDENSSCWVRVAQLWTGNTWGAFSLPRIGDEVVVEFVNGDPDQPLVTGRVHNAERMPPETLPDAQAKTVFRTRSTKGGDNTNFHELSFDDTLGKELIYFHSEFDFQRVVENNDSLKVGFDKKSPGDRIVEIYNNESIKVGLGSGAGTYTLEAASGITLKCGDSQIQITTQGVVISAPAITLKATGDLTSQGTNVTAKADAAMKISGQSALNLESPGETVVKGAMVKIN
ncbi:MAG: type VI secretion system Vgr family protein [Pirellula sp.]|jgi:type VI secretion system secreted protein VgrG